MASIYANSCLAIIAADGDHANRGLQGFRQTPDPQPRSCHQDIFELPDGTVVIERLCPQLSMTKWFERGWTYQEYLFSPRRIVLGDVRVRWECQQSQWQEDLDDEFHSTAVPCPREMVISQNVFLHCWPDLSSYSENVCYYNRRHFTYPEDATAAFAGITSVLSTKFDGGFLYGLPEMFFDVALLWWPTSVVE